MLSSLSKITNPENTSQFKLVKDSNSDGVKNLLLHSSIPITLYDNLLSFRDKGRVYELKGDLLKMITNNKYNDDLASTSDMKLMFDFANEMYFDVKATGKKSTQDRTFMKLLNLPTIMASGVSTIFFQKILMNYVMG